MELDLLQISIGIGIGILIGAGLLLFLNKVKSGSASPAAVKAEFDDYKNEVEAHFETTSKKFQQMTEQYQDLYEHLSVGATSLCRPDSVAATLADQRSPSPTPAKLEAKIADDQADEQNNDAQQAESGASRNEPELDQTPTVTEPEQSTNDAVTEPTAPASSETADIAQPRKEQ